MVEKAMVWCGSKCTGATWSAGGSVPPRFGVWASRGAGSGPADGGADREGGAAELEHVATGERGSRWSMVGLL